MYGTFLMGEAFALGLASGPACVASCGPVLVPSLLGEQAGLRLHGRYLTVFLGARLLGYLLFAAVAWELGTLLSLPPTVRTVVYGSVHLLLAAALLWHAIRLGHRHAAAAPELVTIGARRHWRLPHSAAVFGFLTGISLCPPFVVAGVRAASLGSLAAAVSFFAFFFVGTSIWFVPFAGISFIRRDEAVATVARMAMVIIACYYALIGIMFLAGRQVYGYQR